MRFALLTCNYRITENQHVRTRGDGIAFIAVVRFDFVKHNARRTGKVSAGGKTENSNLTAEDNAVPVENTLEFALALRRQKIPFETHIFPYGYHGLGLGTHPDFPEVRAWPDLAAVWMRKLGF